MSEIGDEPSVSLPILYTTDVHSLDDYWISDLIWTTPRRIVAVQISDLVFVDISEPVSLNVGILTRVHGGSWGLAPSVAPFQGEYQQLVLTPSPNGVLYSAEGPTEFAVLDEAKIVLALTRPDASALASVVVDDPDIPDAALEFIGIFPGGFFNLFGVRTVDPAARSKPFGLSVIDDPDHDGKYLVEFLLGTNAAGEVVTSLDDLNVLGSSPTPQYPTLINFSFVGDPTTPLTDGIDYVPYTDGDAGSPSPISLTVTVR